MYLYFSNASHIPIVTNFCWFLLLELLYGATIISKYLLGGDLEVSNDILEQGPNYVQENARSMAVSARSHVEAVIRSYYPKIGFNAKDPDDIYQELLDTSMELSEVLVDYVDLNPQPPKQRNTLEASDVGEGDSVD